MKKSTLQTVWGLGFGFLIMLFGFVELFDRNPFEAVVMFALAYIVSDLAVGVGGR